MACDLYLDDKVIGRNYSAFIIAEIGQNHQGNVNTAKLLIDAAKDSGADCVKLQKTCVPEKFNKHALERPYMNVNSWGDTYGQHKEYLEFTNAQFIELKKYAADIGILLSASPMDITSLNFLKKINLPFIKIGSGDCNNLEMIKAAAELYTPLIISTGMQDFETVNHIYKTVSQYHNKFCLLHCISAYPAPIEELNLSVIKLYQEKFPDVNIGYSGHEIGIDMSVAAVALGAKVIERHITLNHNQKGTDHVCSLEPREFKLMVQRIRTLETALGKPLKELQPSEVPCYEKLRKSLVLSRNIPEGHKLTQDDLKIKVANPRGIDGLFLNEIVGKIVNKDMKEDDSLTRDCLLE